MDMPRAKAWDYFSAEGDLIQNERSFDGRIKTEMALSIAT